MSQKNHLPEKTPYHNDLKFRIVAAFVGAYIVTEYGGDKPLLSQLLTKFFYIEFGTTLLITFLLVEYIYRITVYLDRKNPWDRVPVQRVFIQLTAGILVPTLASFLLAALYFSLYGINILKTNYHLYALPFIAALITLFNVYYLVRFLLYRLKEHRPLQPAVTAFAGDRSGMLLPVDVVENATQEQSDTAGEPETKPDESRVRREFYIVNTPLKNIPLRMEEICSFYRSVGINYVRTFDQTVNEAYVINQSLKEVEDLLNPAQFFRVNRWLIVNITSCSSFRSGNGKGLDLFLAPPHVDQENGLKEMPYVSVSEDRAQAFKSWINR